MQRRTLIQGGCALALAGMTGARAQIAELNDAINKAGRQRMLSQRMCKGYIALVESVEPGLAQQVLERSMAQFDRQLAELKAFAGTPDLRTTYAALEASWGDFRTTLLDGAPGKAGVPAVMAAAGKVLALAHKGTQQFEALQNKPIGKLVNVAGRQRMLSQRMAAFYLASLVPVDPAGARAEIDKARAEFLTGLDFIRNAPEATPKIRDELQLAEMQWVLFDNALQKTAPAGTLRPQSDVFVASENVLQVMDRITTLYSGLKA
ncbi:MAG: type IV pili methyl-accepting chemotaxis transducer N-terminal domain-containing protein [Ramlibacter sp.]